MERNPRLVVLARPLASLALASVLASVAGAQCELDKLTASDGGVVDLFGLSVSLSGDRALVGAAYHDSATGSDSGSAYIFEKPGPGAPWVEVVKLTASDAFGGDLFGFSVSLWGDRALVGAVQGGGAGFASGSAYVFERDTATGLWVETAKLTASDATTDDEFGFSVSLWGDTALVGARHDDDAGTVSGSAYVFERDIATGLWVETAKLTASDAALGDSFGSSVSLSGFRALVGAPYHDSATGSDSGSAYVFEKPGPGAPWVEVVKLTASDGAAEHEFGRSVSLWGDTALVGAIQFASFGSGSAYVFERDTSTGLWVETAKLTAPDGGVGDLFGLSVSLSGFRALVGAPLHDSATGSDSGSAYVFEKPGPGAPWVETAKLTASDAAAGDVFGRVSLSGDTALVGAYGDDDAASSSGSAYAFSFSGPCAAVIPYGCGVNPAGSLTLISGVPSIGTTVLLGVDNPLGTQPIGTLPFLAVAFQPDPAFPCGTLMPGFGMGGTGASGELLIPFDPPFVFSGPPWTGAGNPVPFALPIPNDPALFGFSAYVQGLMYDPTGAFGVTFGLTEAVELLVGP